MDIALVSMISPPATPGDLQADNASVSVATPPTPNATAPGPDLADMTPPPTPADAVDDIADVSVNLLPSTEDNVPPSYQDPSFSVFIDEDEELLRLIRDELVNTIEEVKRINFNSRPRLIKLMQNKTLKTLTQQVNSILQDLIAVDISALELNNTTFGAALFIQRKSAPSRHWIKKVLYAHSLVLRKTTFKI